VELCPKCSLFSAEQTLSETVRKGYIIQDRLLSILKHDDFLALSISLSQACCHLFKLICFNPFYSFKNMLPSFQIQMF